MKHLLGICFFFFMPMFSVNAAILYIDPATTEMHPGDTLSLGVRITTEGEECINVIDRVITYDPSIVPVDISRGNSIFPVWVEDPVIDKANNRITFAGGIPNGYCGRIAGDPRLTNVVLELIFQAPGLQINLGDTDPTALVSFAPETRVLLNDGKGSDAPLQTFGSEIFVQKKPRSTVVDEWNNRIASDDISPAAFSVSLETDPSIFAGRYFVSFNTTDKQSGLDHYELIEEPLDDFDLFGWGREDAPWVTARSPFLLKDQSLNSTIRVKAIDKAGNEYMAVFTPDESDRGTSKREYVYIGLSIVGGMILLIISGAFLFHWIKRKRVINDEAEETDI